ncbi:chromate resistance protein [Pseudoxanthobacter sp. M-2]|uniref:chromate resistance protein ChrB domain-containing protein n=1 Tax=Pseudoxanthobacter sp. M-2 TaxID=3078754 RepID=UPI0038FC1E55
MDDDHPASDPFVLSPPDLAERLGTSQTPLLLDVRRGPAFDDSEVMIVGAVRRAPETLGEWAAELPCDRPVILYCVHGHEVSRTAAAALRDLGGDARILADGIAAWQAAGLPTRRKLPFGPRWVTRERPKIDRIACPWLVRRFIDPEATFDYVPAASVLAVAAATGATPYDVPGVVFTHAGVDGELCSFDAFLALYDIRDPALDRLATIVRGADTDRFDLAPQSAGLFAISLGLSALIADDRAMLEQGMVLYDALYVWCRSGQHEGHAWPPTMAA